MAKAQSSPTTPVDFVRFTEPISFQKISYASIRNMFCDGLDEHFSFADYLNRRLGSHLGELVEVPVKTWFGLWVFMFGCYLLHDALPLNVQVRTGGGERSSWRRGNQSGFSDRFSALSNTVLAFGDVFVDSFDWMTRALAGNRLA